jgi:RND family efflux transporter MFP subunit
MALALKAKGKDKAVATFDFLPGREFTVELKEVSTEADPATQTYAVTVVMPAPKDVTILPGMTATIRTYRKESAGPAGGGYAVPVDAVPVDGLGNCFVWVVKEKADRAWTVHRREVTVGEMMQDSILVTDGLEQGDHIATAGVHFLQEGQQVRLLGAKAVGA